MTTRKKNLTPKKCLLCDNKERARGLCSGHWKQMIGRKTINGFLENCYNSIRRRSTNQADSSKYYPQIKFIDRQSFYIWAKSNKEFLQLFKIWSESNFNKNLSPTLRLIKKEIGYQIDNMEWMSGQLGRSFSNGIKLLKQKQQVYRILGVLKNEK